jgi:hypothetical protein
MNLTFVQNADNQLAIWCDLWPHPVGWVPVVPEDTQVLIASCFELGYTLGISDGRLEHLNQLRTAFGFDAVARIS